MRFGIDMTTNINVIDECFRKFNHFKLVKAGENTMFIFTPNQTLVATPLQLFLIKHSHGNYIPRLNRIQKEVERGNITSISDLITYNGFRPGNNISQYEGLELIRMDISWVK